MESIQATGIFDGFKTWLYYNVMVNHYVGAGLMLAILIRVIYGYIKSGLEGEGKEHYDVPSKIKIKRSEYHERIQREKERHQQSKEEVLKRLILNQNIEKERRKKMEEERRVKQRKFYIEKEQAKMNKILSFREITSFFEKARQKRFQEYLQKEKKAKEMIELQKLKEKKQRELKEQKQKQAREQLEKSTNLSGYPESKKEFINTLDKGVPSKVMEDPQKNTSLLNTNKPGVRVENRKPTIEVNLPPKQTVESKPQQKSSLFGGKSSFNNLPFGNIGKMDDSTASLFAPTQLEKKPQEKKKQPEKKPEEEKKKEPEKKTQEKKPENPTTEHKPQANQQQRPTLSYPSGDPGRPQPAQVYNPQINTPPNQNSMPGEPGLPSQRPPNSAQLPKLSSQQYLQTYIKYVQNLKEEVPISSKIQNISGSRSSPTEILTELKSLINTIDRQNQKQVTTFGLKLFHTVVHKFINNSNVKSGLERIPPKSRTDQCQKNSINCYVMSINMLRLMPDCKKIWTIVFGKLLKMLEDIYKRKKDLDSFHELELIKCGYIKKYKEVHSKYLSRIDFLVYMLFGLTAFDPHMVVRQVDEKEPNAQRARLEIESWGNVWNYTEFWSLCDVVFQNKHQTYFKPIIFMNILYVLYPRIYEHKKNQANFVQEAKLFTMTIQKSKKYLSEYKKMKEVINLSECEQTENYEFDGDDFVKSIKVLDNRFSEKGLEIKLKASEYCSKANIFYYFSKQK